MLQHCHLQHTARVPCRSFCIGQAGDLSELTTASNKLEKVSTRALDFLRYRSLYTVAYTATGGRVEVLFSSGVPDTHLSRGARLDCGFSPVPVKHN